jgi:hypothetical protein
MKCMKSEKNRREVEIQEKLHAVAAPSLGVLAGNDPRRSETIRAKVRARLRQKKNR